MKNLLTFDEMSMLIRYDFSTGRLFWLSRPIEMFADQRSANSFSAKYAGKEAFTAIDTHGYRHGNIFDRPYLAHRVIWLLANGEWPELQIDHVNGDRSDNRLANLRSVDHLGNGRNTKLHSNNKSGTPGVHWQKHNAKWVSYIYLSGKRNHLGCFENLHEAIAVRRMAEVANGFHPNHGRRT